jgi:hypothetical protein
MCDFCDHVCHVPNLKRHIKNKHKGVRPSTSMKTFKMEKTYQCEKCEKCFFDKSTLNRHVKSHCFRCDLCDKMFKNKRSIEEHIMVHQSKGEASRIVKTKQKAVTWCQNIETVKEISITKVTFNQETIKNILEIQRHTENILLIYQNRGQTLKIDELNTYIEKQTHKTLRERLLKAMISVNPNLYSLSLYKQNLVIQMETIEKPVTPSTLASRRSTFKSTIREMMNDRYIDIISFPEPKETKHESAMEILKQNIMKFSDDEEDNEEDNGDENDNPFSKLLRKIKKKNEKKTIRDKRISQIDWQLKRLPKLARAVNSVYCSEQKSCIKFEILLSKIDNDSRGIRSDLERLIKESKGWLRKYKDWVKRKSSVDINEICNSLV